MKNSRTNFRELEKRTKMQGAPFIRGRLSTLSAIFVSITVNWNIALAATGNEGVLPKNPASRKISYSIDELIGVLEKEGVDTDVLILNPGLLSEIQKIIVDYIDRDIKFKADLDPALSPLGTNPPLAHPITVLNLDTDSVYLRTPALTEESFRKLRNFLSATDSEKTTTIIWDFRFCMYFDNTILGKYEDLFASYPNVHYIALVNKETVGVFEILARLLQDSPNNIVFGEKTAGRPYKSKEVKLRNGGTILFPSKEYVSASGRTITAQACLPGLTYRDTLDAQSFNTKLNDHSSLREDYGIKQAMELVRAHRLFGKKRF